MASAAHSPRPVGNSNNNDASSSKSRSNSNDSASIQQSRLLYGLAKSISKICTITLSPGNVIKGKLISIDDFSSNNGSMNLIIKNPEIVKSNDNFPNSKLDVSKEEIILDESDYLFFDVQKVDFTNDLLSSSSLSSTNGNNGNSNNKSKFMTDSAISNTQFRERELEKWVADDDSLSMSLEDDKDTYSTSKNSNWDQFKTNEEKFGVKSTYDEALYTTKISKDSPRYQELYQEADRLAREIENDNSYNGNLHMAEERGIEIDDSGIDEEDKYSGVARNLEDLKKLDENATLMSMLKLNAGNKSSEFKKPTPGAYVPPSKRAANFHGDSAIISSSAVKATKPVTTNPAVPPKINSTPSAAPSTNTVPAATTASTTASTSTTSTTASSSSSTPTETPATIPKKPTNPSNAKQSSSSNTLLSTKLSREESFKDYKNFSDNFKIPENLHKREHFSHTSAKPSSDKATPESNTSNKTPATTSSSDTSISTAAKPTASNPVKEAPASTPATSIPISPKKTPLIPKSKLDPTKVQTFKMNINSASFTPSSMKTGLALSSNMNMHSNSSTASNSNSNLNSSHINDSSSSVGSPSTRNRKLTSSTQWFFGNKSAPTESNSGKLNSLLNKKFSFLQSGRAEFERREKVKEELENKENSEKDTDKNGSADEEVKKEKKPTVSIIAIKKPFDYIPTWQSTSDVSYKASYPQALEPISTNVNVSYMPYNQPMQMQQRKYMSNQVNMPMNSMQMNNQSGFIPIPIQMPSMGVNVGIPPQGIPVIPPQMHQNGRPVGLVSPTIPPPQQQMQPHPQQMVDNQIQQQHMVSPTQQPQMMAQEMHPQQQQQYMPQMQQSFIPQQSSPYMNMNMNMNMNMPMPMDNMMGMQMNMPSPMNHMNGMQMNGMQTMGGMNMNNMNSMQGMGNDMMGGYNPMMSGGGMGYNNGGHHGGYNMHGNGGPSGRNRNNRNTKK